MGLSLALLLAGCVAVQREDPFAGGSRLRGFEAFAVNGVHANELGPEAEELVSCLRVARRGHRMLADDADVVLELFQLGQEQGDRLGLWLDEGVVARLPSRWNARRLALPVWVLEPGSRAEARQWVERLGWREKRARSGGV